MLGVLKNRKGLIMPFTTYLEEYQIGFPGHPVMLIPTKPALGIPKNPKDMENGNC